MKTSTWTQIQQALYRANHWFKNTPDRALDQAYDAALRIKAIENEHFQGQKITPDSVEYSDRVWSYFNSELKKCLNIIQIRLAEFNLGRSVIGLSEPTNLAGPRSGFSVDDDLFHIDHVSQVCEKLNFIDTIIGKYSPQKPKRQPQNQAVDSVAWVTVQQKNNPNNNSQPGTEFSRLGSTPSPVLNRDSSDSRSFSKSYNSEKKSIPDDLKTRLEMSFLPRSLLRTIGRIQRELNPESEEEIIKNYRKSKVKTIISVRFILLLILVPLLTQQLAKNFMVGPIVDAVIPPHENTEIFLNIDFEEEAFMELHRYRERLEFNQMIGLTPHLEPEEFEERIQEKAREIAEDYRALGNSSIKNIFADFLSIITFFIIIYTNKRDVEILKSFLGDLIYGLSDSAKAFIIILLTDMFVGFHSPHGWEVILESISRHFGLPENRDFNFLFIATFPVILDAVFKYWIFRYLNRSSPSAVSTYKTMNE